MVTDGEDETDESALAEAAWEEAAQLPEPAAMTRGGGASTLLWQQNCVDRSGARSRLLKGEGVDVSIPTRRDINLQMWCQGEAAEPGSFVRPMHSDHGHRIMWR